MALFVLAEIVNCGAWGVGFVIVEEARGVLKRYILVILTGKDYAQMA